MSHKTPDPLASSTSPSNEKTEAQSKAKDASKMLTVTTSSNALPKPVVNSLPPAAPSKSDKLRNSKSKHKSQDKIKLKVSSGKKEALSHPMSLMASFDEVSSMEESMSSSQSMSERQGDKGPLIWEDKLLTKATIPGLLQLLLKFQDRSFIDTFLLTTDYWTTPQEITELLISIYRCPPKDEEVTLRLRVLNIIKKLIESKYSAWRSDSAWETKFNSFLTELDEKFGEQGKSCAALIRQAMKDSCAQESPRRLYSATSPAPARKRFEFFEAPLDEVARQLTLVDHYMFKRISIDEFYHKNFEKKTIDLDMKNNLQKCVDHFNEVSYWAATQILMAPNYKIRAQYLVKFIQLMDHLRQNGNFFSLMALYSTLSMSVIGNLHRSWKELPPAIQTLHKSLVAFLNHTSNYKPYRDALDATTEGGIPILGLIMRDLIYIEEMETKEEGYINWEKMALLAKVFGQISRFQKQKYSYNPQPFIMDHFVDLRSFSLVMNEDELYSLYQKIKPEEDEGVSSRDSIDQGGRAASGRIGRRDSVGSDKDKKPSGVERRVSGRTNFSSSLSEYKRNRGGDMNSVTFGIIRSCFAGIGQQIQLSALDSAVKSPLTKALTDFLEMYDQLNPRDVAGAESITEPVPAVSINMVDLLEEVTSSFNMSKRAGNDGLTITASYVVPQNMPQIIQANKQRLKSMILYHMFALATQVSNTLVIAPFMAKDQTDSSSDSDLDESSISGPLSGGSIGGVAKVIENIRLKFQISDFKPASLSASIDLMNKRAPDAVYEALVPVSDLAEEMREEMIYNADTGHVMQFIISTQEIKESMDLKNKQRVLQQLSAKAPATWTTAEVTKWLECQDLGHYKGSFIENSISGKEILDLEEDDLKEIGVAKLGHLKKLSKAISELREAKPVGNYRDPTPPRARDTDSIAFKCTFNGDLRMMKFRLTTLAEFTERIAAEYGDVSVKFKDEDDDLILLHETNWDLLVSEAETKRSVNLVISQRQESRLSEQVIRQLGIATTTEAVIVANSNGEIQWVNNAGEQLLGWKSSELLSLAVNKVLSKEMMYYTALEGQYNESEEYTVIHTTDTVRKRDRSTATVQLEIQDREVSSSGHDMIMWLFKLKACEGSASPSKDEVKNVLTQAREAAEKSKDSAIIFDEAGNVQAFNKVACDTFGYKLFEIVGKKVLILIPHYPSIAEFTQACAAGPVLTQDKHGSLLSVQAKLQQIKDGSKLYYSLTLKKL